MTENKISEQQEDFNNSYSWILSSENPTDGNIAPYLNPAPEGSPQYTEGWQYEIAEKALRKEAITLNDLRYIMAKEECYNDILSRLWEKFGLNKDNKEPIIEKGKVIGYEYKTPGWNPSWIQTERGRSWIWTWILLKWTIKPYFHKIGRIEEGKLTLKIESHYFGGLWDSRDKLLKVYNDINGELRRVKDTEEQEITQFVRLNEFKEYIEGFKGITIPLPKRLFSEREAKNIFEAIG